MRRPPSLRQGSARFGGIALAVGALVSITGCDTSEDANVERGRQLFLSSCGTCHALAEAGTGQGVGPSLDAAFVQSRLDGMDNDTIEGVVQQQIDNPREINLPETDPLYLRVYMPPDLVIGQDAEDVATYVASVAGVPGAAPPPLGEPPQVFAEKCGSCHSLEPGAGDGTGPNLGDALAGQDAAYIKQQIIDPDSQIAAGFAAGIMPQDFEQQLPGKNLDALVDYILGEVKGGGS